jgi:hypothetical protein
MVPLSYVTVWFWTVIPASADPEKMKEEASVANKATIRRPGAVN